MSALPIDPTDEDIRAWRQTAAFGLTRYDELRAAHQAGVEAERARAAAETLPENVHQGYVWFCPGHNSYGDEWYTTPNEAADDLNEHVGDTHD